MPDQHKDRVKRHSPVLIKLGVILTFSLIIAGALFVTNWYFSITECRFFSTLSDHRHLAHPIGLIGLLLLITGLIIFVKVHKKPPFQPDCEKATFAFLTLWIILMLTYLGIWRIVPAVIFPEPATEGEWVALDIKLGINEYWRVYRPGGWRRVRMTRLRTGKDQAPPSQYLPAVFFLVLFAGLVWAAGRKRSDETGVS